MKKTKQKIFTIINLLFNENDKKNIDKKNASKDKKSKNKKKVT